MFILTDLAGHHNQVMIPDARIHQSIGNPIERAKSRTLKMTIVIGMYTCIPCYMIYTYNILQIMDG